tara:strand:- start:1917 stop:2660 length:744 start_codon:yes stop_codon:yes gene_type:complete
MALPLEDFKVGNVYESRKFGPMEVTYLNGSRDVGITFLNTGTIVDNLQKGNVIRGAVKDFGCATVEGVGYLGTNRKVTSLPAYHCWKHMLVRCYSENYHSTRGTYRDCSVEKSWHNFTTFEVWFDKNYVEGYHLDKDLLEQGNRVYSKDTCCFIPDYLNSLIVEREIVVDGCEVGVSKRRKKGSTEYNGLYNIQISGNYLGRTGNLEDANSRYKEFKSLLFEEAADKLEGLSLITKIQADKLRTRRA